MATCPSIQLPALLFACILFVLFLLFVVVSLVNQSRTKGALKGKFELSRKLYPRMTSFSDPKGIIHYSDNVPYKDRISLMNYCGNVF